MKPPLATYEHILTETGCLLKTSRALSLSKFLADETLQRAFVRSLEIIGEAVKNLPDDFKARYPDLDWRRMVGTRDRLIHGYFSVDFKLVWDIVQNKIPPGTPASGVFLVKSRHS